VNDRGESKCCKSLPCLAPLNLLGCLISYVINRLKC
jgi:hypothetical protein